MDHAGVWKKGVKWENTEYQKVLSGQNRQKSLYDHVSIFIFTHNNMNKRNYEWLKTNLGWKTNIFFLSLRF